MKNVEVENINNLSEKRQPVPLRVLMDSMNRLSRTGILPPDLLKDPCRDVNPELVDFLDGDGKKGYAVDYESTERSEPGTVIEMEWEKNHLTKWICTTLDERDHYTDARDIVMLEIGTAPALGSLEGLWAPPVALANKLRNRRIHIISMDISWGMAGLGAITLRNSQLEDTLNAHGLDVNLYVAHADGFHVIENARNGSLTAISAPFGILGYGLGDKTLDNVISLCAAKLEPGGLLSMNGYTEGWSRYIETLKGILRTHVPEDQVDHYYKAIVPFVIDIYRDEVSGRSMMSVGNGRGFPCDTHLPNDVAAVYERNGLQVVDLHVTPQQYCLIPKEILAKRNTELSSDPHQLMEAGRRHISTLMGDIPKGGEIASQICDLHRRVMAEGIAPYYTVTGRKI